MDHSAPYRVCYLHVGTHSTGMTSIQRYCADNDVALAAAGLLYPRAARLDPESPGHHNVAFELSGDERFAPRLPKLVDVVAEIASRRPAQACLSSEIFEYLHVMPERMAELRDALGSIGYSSAVIVYLRSQATYIEALYAELVQRGLRMGFGSFLAGILREGAFRYADVWTFRFDYSVLVDAFARAFGAESVVVRPYAARLHPQALIADFFAVTAPPGTFLHADGEADVFYDQRRPSTGDVLRRLVSNRRPGPAATAAITRLLEFEPDAAALPFEPLDAEDIARVSERFAADDALVATRWKIPLQPVTADRAARTDTPDAQAVRRLIADVESVLR
jgi:hypothetical protein